MSSPSSLSSSQKQNTSSLEYYIHYFHKHYHHYAINIITFLSTSSLYFHIYIIHYHHDHCNNNALDHHCITDTNIYTPSPPSSPLVYPLTGGNNLSGMYSRTWYHCLGSGTACSLTNASLALMYMILTLYSYPNTFLDNGKRLQRYKLIL